jgi:DNA-binding transcriptional regulator WhiA
MNISDFINAESLQKAIVRGTFLCGGSANNPEKKYH